MLSILYVEDNDDLRETIGLLLEASDREVVTCANAEAALAAVAARPFDVLITDVSLPGLSGTELARRVLADDPQRWVVLCSGYEFRHGLEQLGPNVRSLSKPFEVEELDALMGEIAAQRAAG
ncbi:MAG TPA: response regulator [Burkholderiaceae bacterium]|nr:response regulator [Burkholderiaceae bacterium]